MPKYAAFLRGINVGGHHKVPMADLRKTLEEIGCQNVKTFLASGNAVFEADRQSAKALSKKVSDVLEKRFGFEIPTIIMNGSVFEGMVASDPFGKIKVGKDTRLYVTLYAQKPKQVPKTPYTASDKSFRILDITPTAAFAVLDTSITHTTEFMKFLDQTFGKNVTTRNWNTIQKMAK